MLNNFPIFTHARITKFNIKAFGEDRAYLLFLDQMHIVYTYRTLIVLEN